MLLPDGRHTRLPGALWPAAAREQAQGGGGTRIPLVAIEEVSRKFVDPFYDRWHDLGRCRRPFGQENFVLRVGADVVAAVTSASTVSRTVTETQHRRNTVELARIARRDDHPHALRALLRLYRYLAPAWRYWTADSVVAYALAGKRGGELYRFDGWTRVRSCRRSGGGGTWSRPSAANAIGDGIKTLWTHPLRHARPEPGEDRAADATAQLLLL